MLKLKYGLSNLLDGKVNKTTSYKMSLYGIGRHYSFTSKLQYSEYCEKKKKRNIRKEINKAI
jgi:hypothetical protein